MQRCSFNSKLGPFHDGELDDVHRMELEQHILICADCAAELDEYRAVSGRLTSIAVPPASAQFLRRLQASADRIDQLSLARFVLRLTGVAAAVFLMARGYLAFVDQSPGRVPVGLAAWEQKAIAPEVDNPNSSADTQFSDFIAAGLSGGRQ
jgi:anti-sigma factor RsiW